MPALKPPADKLPLTARKNYRDEWESKKPEYEAKMKELLGETWTIEVNPNLIFTYAPSDYSARIGSVINWYFEPFISNLQRFVTDFGADGVQELNTTCNKHQVLFTPQEDTNFSYGGLVVVDGVLRLVFADGKLATNVGDASRDFGKALQDAPAPAGGSSAYNIIARGSVRERYEPKIDALRSAIVEMVNMPDLKLNPNFENNAAELAKSPAQVKNGWDKGFGYTTLSYFEALKYNLNRYKFKDDDMQQEAFQEAVDKKEVVVRILPKWEDGKSRYNEVKVEDGILYIQTTTDKWGVNTGEAGSKLLDIL